MLFDSRICLIGVACLSCMPVFAANPDNRELADWSQYPQIVRVEHFGSVCTGQYVAPNLILTAAHCFKEKVLKDYPQIKPIIRRYDANKPEGTYSFAKLVMRGQESGNNLTIKNLGIDDYAFLLLEDKDDYCNDCVYDLYNGPNAQQLLPVESIGFGGMKILTDKPLKSKMNFVGTDSENSAFYKYVAKK